MSNSVCCAACGEPLDGLPDLPSGDRSPCPRCGSIARTFSRSIANGVGVSDHYTALGTRNNKLFAFRESLDLDGRASSADRADDGSLSYSVSGSSPQGEEDTIRACRLLVRRLNSRGDNWSDAVPGEGVVDCEAAHAGQPQRKLQIQVVRAATDQKFWPQLNIQGFATNPPVDSSTVASEIKQAIEKKANERVIPSSVRPGLTLALDATRLPAFAFHDVVEVFHREYSVWTKSLGFQAVWLVGPVPELVCRLDESEK
jgi:hypothetical protein